jgi:class 3 adenylate cyclase
MEGSTRLFQALGRADYRSLLEDHHRLLHSAFAALGGVVVETVGDSCLAVFTGASDALAASLDAQLALGTQRWPRDARVRVRIGIHTGEARPVGDGYVTLALHQGAHIMAAAHGGQILVSEITRQLVAADPPRGIEFAYLGKYRFKDFEVPQGIFQLCHPRLPAAFPPLLASKVIGDNFPPTSDPPFGAVHIRTNLAAQQSE